MDNTCNATMLQVYLLHILSIQVVLDFNCPVPVIIRPSPIGRLVERTVFSCNSIVEADKTVCLFL